jgi:DNA-binding transcriptional LysR family regulator
VIAEKLVDEFGVTVDRWQSVPSLVMMGLPPEAAEPFSIDHAWATRGTIELTLTLSENPMTRNVLDWGGQGLEVPREKVSTVSVHVRTHLVATGRYLTILPGSALRFNAKRWSLKALPVDLRVKPMPTAILTLKNRTLSSVVQVFIEHAREIAKSIMKTA